MSGRGTEGPQRPVATRVQQVSSRFFEAVAAILGEGFAEARIDDDDHLHATVIDPTPADEATIMDVARRLGIADRVRIERAELGALRAWERVRQDLLRLQDASPPVLVMHPTPEPGYRRPPFEIQLTADAANVAETLHQSHGSHVRLIVGALEYPTRQPEYSSPADIAARLVDPREMRVELDGPLTITSGETLTHGLLLTNLSAEPIEVGTNGQLTEDVIDPATGAVVGGYPGSQPPGRWAVAADLTLQDGRRLRTPSLELTVVE